MAFLDSLGKKQTYRKSPTSTTQAFPSYPMWLEERGLRTRQCGVRVCTFGEDAGGGGAVRICVCVPLSTSFTTQLIRLAALGNCNVHSRAPFIERLGPCLPRTPFFSLQIKCTVDFLSLEHVLLPPCPRTPPSRCCHLLPHLPGKVIGLSENWGEFQAQNEVNF